MALDDFLDKALEDLMMYAILTGKFYLVTFLYFMMTVVSLLIPVAIICLLWTAWREWEAMKRSELHERRAIVRTPVASGYGTMTPVTSPRSRVESLRTPDLESGLNYSTSEDASDEDD